MHEVRLVDGLGKSAVMKFPLEWIRRGRVEIYPPLSIFGSGSMKGGPDSTPTYSPNTMSFVRTPEHDRAGRPVFRLTGYEHESTPIRY